MRQCSSTCVGALAAMPVGQAQAPDLVSESRLRRHSPRWGATVEKIQSLFTPEMLDGICRFFEARSYNDFTALPQERQQKVLPFIAERCTWRAACFTGRDVMPAYNYAMAAREAAIIACQPSITSCRQSRRSCPTRPSGPHPGTIRTTRWAISPLHCHTVWPSNPRHQSTEPQATTACQSECRSSGGDSTTPACSSWRAWSSARLTSPRISSSVVR